MILCVWGYLLSVGLRRGFFAFGVLYMNTIRDFYRRHVYLSNLIDEAHYLLNRM